VTGALKDLVDIPRLQGLLDTLGEIHGLPAAVSDTDGTILAATARQEICTRFHRARPETARQCLECDAALAAQLATHPPQAVSRCPFGLVDGAASIIVEGRHLGAVLSGQLFTEPPDEARFIRQAREYGFDERAYLEAVSRVPVVAEERLRSHLRFLGGFAELLAEQGLKHQRQLETETALRESEARYRELFEAESDAIVLVDNETGRILEANGAAAAMYGYAREEMLKKLNTDLSAEPEETQRVTHGMPLVAARVVTIPLRLHRKKDGSVFPVEITGRFFRYQGRAVHIAAIRDITERTRALEQIRDLNANLERRVAARTAELQAANRELEALVYTIAHDLRAPLRAVDGYAGIVEEEYGERLDEEGRRLVGQVRAGAHGMDRLIDDLLEYSRTGSAELHRGPVDMQALAAAVYEEIATEQVRRTFRFTVGELPQADGDAVLLRQVWSNLLANAVKYTLPRAEQSIEIGGASAGGMTTYWVRDTGVGFNQAYAHKLFGVFQRLHALGDFEGTGIGLAIVQRVVARHGGRVWAEGAVNAGATFSFSLPAGPAPPERGSGG
jgi:PAS domain S-box-containing protein